MIVELLLVDDVDEQAPDNGAGELAQEVPGHRGPCDVARQCQSHGHSRVEMCAGFPRDTGPDEDRHTPAERGEHPAGRSEAEALGQGSERADAAADQYEDACADELVDGDGLETLKDGHGGCLAGVSPARSVDEVDRPAHGDEDRQQRHR